MTPRKTLALILAMGGLVACGQGLYIPAKAQLAQVLLERSWDRARQGIETPTPWSWADTWPVARLRAPEHDEDLIVLAGASGSVLAFGPGHLTGTTPPHLHGNIVLGGHRDTHFAFLEHLEDGDELILETPAGPTRRFVIESRQIVDHRETEALDPTEQSTLTLVTCYPFHTVQVGGPLRYVVQATEKNLDKAKFNA